MTLWVNAIFGYPAIVELDLLAIIQGDLGLGDQLVITDPTVLQMTYAKTKAGIAQERINALINTVFPNNIIVTGVDSSYGFMNGLFWQSITGIGGGVTVVTTGSQCSGSSPLYTNELIKVVYDTSACGGQGYWVRNLTNDKVVEPRTVILFHELAHAFHWASRTSQFCASGEAQAIGDENLMRVQFSLPRRSQTNTQGGCGAPESYNPWEAIGCFIVTSITGSPRAAQVLELHYIRDALLRPTRLGRALFDKIFFEYYQCAPRVVQDMQADPELKRLIARMAVEPLLDVFLLAKLHVRLDLRSGAVDAEITHVLEQWQERLNDESIDPNAVEYLAQLLSRIKASLDRATVETFTVPLSVEQWTPDLMFRYIASTIMTSTPDTSALAWGIMHPLTISWGILGHSAGPDVPASLSGKLAEAIEDWLALAPVDWSIFELDVDAITADLQSLATEVITDRAVGHRFGAKLLSHCPARLRPQLAEAMRAADLLRPVL